MKNFFILCAACLTLNAFAQATKDFKSETTALITTFEKAIQLLGTPSTSDEELKKSQSALKDAIVSPNIATPYHFAGIDSLVTLKDIILGIKTQFPAGYDFKLNYEKMVFEDIHIDASRNCYRVKATLKSRFVASVITTTEVDTFIVHTLTSIDSTKSLDTIRTKITKTDTTEQKHFSEITFYCSTSLMFSKYEPLKIDAIALSKAAPVYSEKLSELTQWWVALSPKWKTKISKELKFPEVPTDYFLDWVRGMKKIDLTGLTKEDVRALSQFKGIEELNLSNMELDTLDFLVGMTGLKNLDLSNNKLKSIAGVESLINLEVLQFNNNQVVDITPLGSCTNLMTLLFNENQVERIDAVKNLPRLLTLRFENNKVIDVEALRGCRGIKDLNMSKNKDIESLEPISHLATMQRLDCYNTRINSLAPLKSMTGLYDLNIGYTKINSLDEIKHLTHLSKLDISGNIIDDFSALSRFDRLSKFNCSTTKISDISPFLNLNHLTEFTAAHTDFTKADIQRLKKKFPNCAITYF